MKVDRKHTEIFWDQIGNHPRTTSIPRMTTAVLKFMLYLILFISATYIIYTLKLIKTSSSPCSINHHLVFKKSGVRSANINVASSITKLEKTQLKHIVFGIAASSELWETRKNYIKLWWNKKAKMRGFVWLDKPVKTQPNEGLPPVRISGNTSDFPYNNKLGNRSAIRISRIVSETVRLKLGNVRWFVMGDDDTVFITENLVRVLSKYDHNRFYYIGSSSESHTQNIHFSYGMAYGGGGIAISYPLAVALEKMQDRCIQRYPTLYGSDDRLHACMAELGVPLTKELGFHQYDVYGNLFGLLSAHPVTPLVSLHHLDLVDPIFPETTRIEALKQFMLPTRVDSAGLLQQSICYDKSRNWTISVSWGFSVQVFKGIILPREVEKPSLTFLNWYRNANHTGFPFNTRRFTDQNTFKFYMTKVQLNSMKNQTVSVYEQHPSACRWNPDAVDTVVVYKKPDPQLWDRGVKMEEEKNGCGRGCMQRR
ncbi:hypothetical protein L1887_27032 [Cichorium endivia]|nr:hypothetical protein L1887_27032 [Cichorium endivia]